MALGDPLRRFWYLRVSRTRRRDLRHLYYATDWKFAALVLAFLACAAVALVILPH